MKFKEFMEEYEETVVKDVVTVINNKIEEVYKDGNRKANHFM